MDVTNVQVNFTISSENDFCHEELTERIGLKPTYLRKKGELLKNGRKFHLSEWGIGTEYEPSLNIDNQLFKITEQLIGKECIINDMCYKNSAKCHFVIVINVEEGKIPVMAFDQDFIHFASSINAQVGFDLYVFTLDK